MTEKVVALDSKRPKRTAQFYQCRCGCERFNIVLVNNEPTAECLRCATHHSYLAMLSLAEKPDDPPPNTQ